MTEVPRPQPTDPSRKPGLDQYCGRIFHPVDHLLDRQRFALVTCYVTRQKPIEAVVLVTDLGLLGQYERQVQLVRELGPFCFLGKSPRRMLAPPVHHHHQGSRARRVFRNIFEHLEGRRGLIRTR